MGSIVTIDERRRQAPPSATLPALGSIVCTLVLIAIWAPFFWLCAYATPALDDFAEAQWGDFWTLQLSRYRGYTGRFVGSALQALTPWHWQSLVGYRLSALARLLLLVSALGMLGVALNRAWLRATTTELLYLACLFSIALLANFPSPAQFFYWYSSSVIYLVPFAVLLSSVSLLLPGASTWRRPVRLTVAGLGFFYVAGNVEMLPVLVLALGVPLVITHRGRPWVRERSTELWTVLAVTGVGLAINLAAPGNRTRIAEMHVVERSQDLLGFASRLADQVIHCFVTWSLDRYTLLAALLATPVFWRLARRGLPHLRPSVAAGLWVYAQVVLIAVPLWGLGFLVERAAALAFCFFVLGLFACSAAVVVDLARRYGERPTALALVLAASALCTLTLPSHNQIRRAYGELTSGWVARYAAAERQRAELTIHAATPDVVVPPLGAVSQLVAPITIQTRFGEDVLAETPAQWWGNNLYATFYGKRTLRLSDPSEEVPRQSE